MAETSNIASMSELLSTEIFSQVFWEKTGPYNQNWECITDRHRLSADKSKTHPSDVVFAYREPYDATRTYVTCDLKSYAKESISVGSLRKGLKSLIESVECAQLSAEWQKLYKVHTDNFNVVGLLFIYNHDGDYGKDFARLLEQATGKYLKVPKGVRVFVMGPEDIFYLNNIAVDIRLQRGDKKIGEQKVCSIFYPDLIERKVLLNRNQLAATLETLLSPFLVYIYKLPADSSKSGAIVYYRRPGTEVNEFVYLIDYLFHYQLVKDMAEITFRLPFAHKDASAVFAKAKKLYMSYETDSSDFEDRMKKIKYSSMGNIRRVFSDTEIGMRL